MAAAEEEAGAVAVMEAREGRGDRMEAAVDGAGAGDKDKAPEAVGEV